MAAVHNRNDYRVPDEAETWPGKLFCLVWGVVFAPALLPDLHDRLYNERFSGAEASAAQMLVIVFWAVFVVCELEGVTAHREWVLAGMVVPSLVLQGIIFQGRSRFPLWNREEDYMFPPSSLPQPIEESSAKAFAERRMPPLCCADADMRMVHTCLHTGDVSAIPRGSLYVSVLFRPASSVRVHGLVEELFCLHLPFLWVLLLLCLMLELPPVVATHCLLFAVLLTVFVSLLRFVAHCVPVSSRLNDCMLAVYMVTSLLGGSGLLAYVIFYHLW